MCEIHYGGSYEEIICKARYVIAQRMGKGNGDDGYEGFFAVVKLEMFNE